ncbi:MAG TPA: ABC transporter ATP-binding protein [Phycisphaerae bacterium]|nr:ABC transporter ATP-binding protein [Phycisphaerae bacterium]
MKVVECIALTKVFQDFWGRDRVRAVDKLDLDINPGEIFGLLGPNGSGKSTTIKMLLGLLYPTSGSARVFGRVPTDTAIKARIGFMPEESYLYRFLTARETLDYYGRLFKLDRFERRRRTDQLIEMIGLKRAANRPVGTYSKGMARRIGLAQALVNDPDFLILDEPTTGLDPIGTRQIKDVIRILGERGKTVLLCSHLLADVEDVCDRVAIMYGGKMQTIGTVRELLVHKDETQITTRRLDAKALSRVREMIGQAGGEVVGVAQPTDRLEDLFLRVVGGAQREQLETSGAESTVGVSDFLSGERKGGVELVASLVDAGKQMVEGPAPGKEPVEVKPAKAAARREVLERLTEKEPSPAASEPVESPVASAKPDKAVIDRLVGGGSQEPKS